MTSEPGVEPAPPQTRDALHNLCLADPVWNERYVGWTELGHGGTASVVRTRSRITGEDIALKVFPRLSADEWKRYYDEVRNAQRLASPFIVRTYSPFPRSTFAWIEMEWVEGENLRQAIEREAPAPFAVARAVAVATSVAQALAAAHAEGVIHRDVKPANILLPAQGKPAAKLSDFGLSRLTDAARLTGTGVFVGTPQFAPPEVIEGGLALPASDVYALSLCLYLMLSGNRPPFEIQDETSPTQWLHAHTSQPPRAIASVNAEVPQALEQLLARGLDKRPENRPSADELVASLGALVRDTGASTLSATWPRVPAGRRRVRAAIVCAAIAAALGVGMLARRHDVTEPPAASPLPPAATALPVMESATALPASASPRDTEKPATVAAAPAELALDVEYHDGLLIVRGPRESLTHLHITMTALNGSRHQASPPEALAPGEDLYLAGEAFDPPLPSSFAPERVEIAAADGQGRARETKVSVRKR